MAGTWVDKIGKLRKATYDCRISADCNDQRHFSSLNLGRFYCLGKPFVPHEPSSRVTAERSGDFAWLRLPSASGLNEVRLQQTAELFDQLMADRQVQGIILRGDGDVFLPGADLPFFVRSIVAGDIERVMRFTQQAHQWLARIENSTKPVIAWVHGAAFGAGVEVALACHLIVATERAKFSLPETALGIYPGMGGTQRLPRRIGASLAKWMIYTGAIVPSPQAFEIGLIDALSAESISPSELLQTHRRREQPTFGADSRLGILERFFKEHRVAQLLDPNLVQPSEPELVRGLIQIRNNAPIALRAAERLIDEGLEMSLEESLQRELSDLRQIFATEDALSGLLTFGKSRARFADR